jgi:hypothetical protein
LYCFYSIFISTIFQSSIFQLLATIVIFNFLNIVGFELLKEKFSSGKY